MSDSTQSKMTDTEEHDSIRGYFICTLCGEQIYSFGNDVEAYERYREQWPQHFASGKAPKIACSECIEKHFPNGEAGV